MQGSQPTSILRGTVNVVPIPTAGNIPLMDQDLEDVSMDLGTENSKGEAPPLPLGGWLKSTTQIPLTKRPH